MAGNPPGKALHWRCTRRYLKREKVAIQKRHISWNSHLYRKFGMRISTCYSCHPSHWIETLPEWTPWNQLLRCRRRQISLKREKVAIQKKAHFWKFPPITLCTSGFCWSSGNDMNSSTLKLPELSRSSFLNLQNESTLFIRSIDKCSCAKKTAGGQYLPLPQTFDLLCIKGGAHVKR